MSLFFAMGSKKRERQAGEKRSSRRGVNRRLETTRVERKRDRERERDFLLQK
jgi:hypothetical protein